MYLEFPTPLITSTVALSYPSASHLTRLNVEVFPEKMSVCSCGLADTSRARKASTCCAQSKAELKKTQLQMKMCLGQNRLPPATPPEYGEEEESLKEFEVMQRIDLSQVDPLLLCGHASVVMASNDVTCSEIEVLHAPWSTTHSATKALPACRTLMNPQ